MGWLDDLMHTKVFNDKFKKGGRIPKRFLGGPIQDEVIAGGPPNRGRKMYGDSLFGYMKKGGRVPKRFLGGGFENLLGLNKPAPPPAGSTMMEKIGNFMFSGKSDKATKDAMDAITESITGKKVTFKKGGYVKKFIQ